MNTTRDIRIARQARAVARAQHELHEAQKALREARAKRDAALTRLEHMVDTP